MSKVFVGVCRVSTTSQGVSKLGLSGQRSELERWAEFHGYEFVTIMDEVASGSWKLRDRPVMTAALALAKKLKTKVVVTKTDRCSRNLSIIDDLIHQRQLVMTVDLGANPDEFIGTVYAGLAVKERKMIGLRTKAGLAAAKARGVVLGNQTNLREAQAKGVASIKAKADRFAEKVRAPIERMISCGMTYKEIAGELNALETASPRNREWNATTVSRIVARLREI